jgi:hypothetical protein
MAEEPGTPVREVGLNVWAKLAECRPWPGEL